MLQYLAENTVLLFGHFLWSGFLASKREEEKGEGAKDKMITRKEWLFMQTQYELRQRGMKEKGGSCHLL